MSTEKLFFINKFNYLILNIIKRPAMFNINRVEDIAGVFLGFDLAV